MPTRVVEMIDKISPAVSFVFFLLLSRVNQNIIVIILAIIEIGPRSNSDKKSTPSENIAAPSFCHPVVKVRVSQIKNRSIIGKSDVVPNDNIHFEFFFF